MKVAGIVAEYNPFHSGHAYHIAKTREAGATHVAVVMSGNFVSRGEAAIFSKWARAKAAVLGGADLVIELPSDWSVSGAERFSQSAVRLLLSLGCVDILSFGSESVDLEKLGAVADFLLSDKSDAAIKKRLLTSVSYAASREDAVADALGAEFTRLISKPNDILAIEYLKALRGSGVSPLAVGRRGAAHDQPSEKDGFASATHIRRMILERKFDKTAGFIPPDVFKLYREELDGGFAVSVPEIPERLLTARLRAANDLSRLPDTSEGLENRVAKAILSGVSFEDALSLCKTKRYPTSRLRRILLCAALGIEKGSEPPGYIKILALNSRGAEILASAKPALPVITKPAAPGCAQLLKKESARTDFYALLSPVMRPCGLEYTMSPCRI